MRWKLMLLKEFLIRNVWTKNKIYQLAFSQFDSPYCGTSFSILVFGVKKSIDRRFRKIQWTILQGYMKRYICFKSYLWRTSYNYDFCTPQFDVMRKCLVPAERTCLGLTRVQPMYIIATIMKNLFSDDVGTVEQKTWLLLSLQKDVKYQM